MAERTGPAPEDRCEWDDCPRAWMGTVTIDHRQSSGPLPQEEYWLCTMHLEPIRALLMAHHHPREVDGE